jgi:glutaredoxin
MNLRNRYAIGSVIFLLALAPSLSHSQSIGDFLKLIPNDSSANSIVNSIKSLSEITLHQIEPGTGPENADGKIVLYRTASCPYCKRAAAYMRAKNIGFVERDIQANPSYKAEYRRLGGKGVPLIVFQEKTMSGFSEAAFDRYYADVKSSLENASTPAMPAPTVASGSMNNLAIQSGDTLIGKIAGVTVYIEPAKSKKLIVLGKLDEIIYMGEERKGFLRVTTQNGEGWVDKLLVKKQ